MPVDIQNESCCLFWLPDCVCHYLQFKNWIIKFNCSCPLIIEFKFDMLSALLFSLLLHYFLHSLFFLFFNSTDLSSCLPILASAYSNLLLTPSEFLISVTVHFFPTSKLICMYLKLDILHLVGHCSHTLLLFFRYGCLYVFKHI